MLASFTIAFREAFEALIIIAIVIAYLKKTGRHSLVSSIVLGGIAAAVASMLAGLSLHFAFTVALEKELVEAVSAFIAVPVLTSVLYWMAKRGPRIKEEIESIVERRAEAGKGAYIGMALLGFIVVFREGFETVLFTLPLLSWNAMQATAGIALGVLASLLLAIGIARYGVRISLRRFFYTTSILLVLIASGILGYGVHELIEYLEEESRLELGVWSVPIYSLDIDPSSPLHEKNIVGSLLSVLVGYTTEMELLRALAQFSYLVLALALVNRAFKASGEA